MKGKRFSEDTIIKVLKEAEAGMKLSDLCRSYGISEQTYYRWKSKYGGMDVSEARRLKQLEEENRRLKRAVADLTLDNQILRDVNSRKW
jgi:putative transposase